MRVNPNYTGDMLAAISESQQKEQTALQQLASGKRVSQPSDDPAASAALVANLASTKRDAAYQQSVSSIQSMLQTADSTLNSVVTALTRAITLGTQGGGDGTLTTANRQEIAQNVQGVLDGVVQAANTKYQGVYLFGGTETANVPFQVDSSGAVTYHGDPQINVVAISNGRTVQMNVPGDQLFTNPAGSVFDSLHNLVFALQSSDQAGINSATAQVSSALSELSAQRVFYGNTLNQLDSANTYLQQDTINLASQENDLIAVDITKAATDFSQAVLANSAALQAFGKVNQKTLLDYLS
jgi:flagellar hook-associated protein 3 FlgL